MDLPKIPAVSHAGRELGDEPNRRIKRNRAYLAGQIVGATLAGLAEAIECTVKAVVVILAILCMLSYLLSGG